MVRGGWDLGFGVWGSRLGIWGLGFRFQGRGFRSWDSGLRATPSICTEAIKVYLTQCIHLSVLESQPPHKSVNSIF